MYRQPAPPSETSNTASTPAPFSPFSSAFSINSDITTTSDEAADLGAFSTVFRALSQLQRTRITSSASSNRSSPTPSASPSVYVTDLPPDTESDARLSSSSLSSSSQSSDADSDSYISDIYGRPLEKFRSSRRERDSRGTVWNQEPVASYLSPSSRSDVEEEEGHPEGSSLGAFESALAFLAGERARLSNKLNHSTPTSTSLSLPADEDSAVALSQRSLDTTPKNKKKIRKGRRERERMRAAQETSEGERDNGLTAGEVSSSYEETDGPLEASTSNRSEGITPIFRQSARSARHKKHHFTEETPLSLDQDAVDADELNRVTNALRSHLLSLAGQLSEQFPADARVLSSMQFDLDRFSTSGGVLLAGEPQVGADGSGFWDGLGAQGDEKGKVHVFVDHSNILIGFLEWIKRQFAQQSHTSSVSIPGQTSSVPAFAPRKPKLSHASLILLLERGRKVGKRVLVASSPLHQGLDDVVEMGYEVSVLQRVAIKEGSGAGTPINDGGSQASWSTSRRPDIYGRRDSVRSNGASQVGTGFYASGGRDGGSGGSSTESGVSRGASGPSTREHPSGKVRGSGHRRFPSAPAASSFLSGGSSSATPSILSLNSYNSNTSSSTVNQITGGSSRPRYREEAVDELLQLKILQVLIASSAPPPRGSTIVLATGDGASSQFNRDGFLGCVRQAVDRGWRVELVGWEEGRSRAWNDLAIEIRSRRRAQSGPGKGGLFMISLEKWGWDMFDSRTSL